MGATRLARCGCGFGFACLLNAVVKLRRLWLQVFAPGGRQAAKALALRITDCCPALLRRALGPSPQRAMAQGGASPTYNTVFASGALAC
jgi:hypothetical protein